MVKGLKLRTPDLSQQRVFAIKEIPRTDSCEPVESHHCLHPSSNARGPKTSSSIMACHKGWFYLSCYFHSTSYVNDLPMQQTSQSQYLLMIQIQYLP